MHSKTIYLDDLEQSKYFAHSLARHLSSGDVITFSGDLGAGKTTLIQHVINGLSVEKIEVTSPTFNLLHIYKLTHLELWHFDLYRLNNAVEVYELGIEDAFLNGVSLIEWPEVITNILPENRLEIRLSFTEKEGSRIIHLTGFYKWAKILENEL